MRKGMAKNTDGLLVAQLFLRTFALKIRNK